MVGYPVFHDQDMKSMKRKDGKRDIQKHKEWEMETEKGNTK